MFLTVRLGKGTQALIYCLSRLVAQLFINASRRWYWQVFKLKTASNKH